MIRHKVTGTELAWRQTADCDEGQALVSAEDQLLVVYAYPKGRTSSIYPSNWNDTALYQTREGLTAERALAKAVEFGVVEVIPDESSSNDYDAIHQPSEADGQLGVYVEALAVIAAHEWSTVDMRTGAVAELRRLAFLADL